MMAMLMRPFSHPELWNASCIAKIPVPKHPFSRCASVSEFLKNNFRHNFVLMMNRKLTTWDVARFDVNADRNHRHALRRLPCRRHSLAPTRSIALTRQPWERIFHWQTMTQDLRFLTSLKAIPQAPFLIVCRFYYTIQTLAVWRNQTPANNNTIINC